MVATSIAIFGPIKDRRRWVRRDYMQRRFPNFDRDIPMRFGTQSKLLPYCIGMKKRLSSRYLVDQLRSLGIWHVRPFEHLKSADCRIRDRILAVNGHAVLTRECAIAPAVIAVGIASIQVEVKPRVYPRVDRSSVVVAKIARVGLKLWILWFFEILI